MAYLLRIYFYKNYRGQKFLKEINANIVAGNNKLLIGDYKGAILEFTKAIIFDPTLPHPYVSRAAAKFELMDYEGAVSDCNEALKLHFKSEYNSGRTLSRNTINPIFGRLYYLIGLCKILLDDKENGFLNLNTAHMLGNPDAADMIRIYT